MEDKRLADWEVTIYALTGLGVLLLVIAIIIILSGGAA